MLTAVDLFSGIGSFSYAFHGTFRTVMYCEIDEECRHVLRTNMDKGRIDKAPIIHDVHLLNKASVTTRRVDAVFGGFPCQDISTAKANGEGLAGPRSSLFWEIMRIIDDCGSVRWGQ